MNSVGSLLSPDAFVAQVVLVSLLYTHLVLHDAKGSSRRHPPIKIADISAVYLSGNISAVSSSIRVFSFSLSYIR